MKLLLGITIIALFSALTLNAHACPAIEAKFVEFSEGAFDQYGIDWTNDISGEVLESDLFSSINSAHATGRGNGIELSAIKPSEGARSAEDSSVDLGLKLEMILSTNCVAMEEHILLTAKLVNTGNSDFAVDYSDLQVWLSMSDSKGSPIKGLPFMDIIYAPGESSQLVLSAGRSEVIRGFGAHVETGKWKGFGSSGTHEGAGLVLNRDAGMTCFPLKIIPGDYLLQYHLMIRSAEEDPETIVEIASDKMKLSVQSRGN